MWALDSQKYHESSWLLIRGIQMVGSTAAPPLSCVLSTGPPLPHDRGRRSEEAHFWLCCGSPGGGCLAGFWQPFCRVAVHRPEQAVQGDIGGGSFLFTRLVECFADVSVPGVFLKILKTIPYQYTHTFKVVSRISTPGGNGLLVRVAAQLNGPYFVGVNTDEAQGQWSDVYHLEIPVCRQRHFFPTFVSCSAPWCHSSNPWASPIFSLSALDSRPHTETFEGPLISGSMIFLKYRSYRGTLNFAGTSNRGILNLWSFWHGIRLIKASPCAVLTISQACGVLGIWTQTTMSKGFVHS